MIFAISYLFFTIEFPGFSEKKLNKILSIFQWKWYFCLFMEGTMLETVQIHRTPSSVSTVFDTKTLKNEQTSKVELEGV